MKSPISLPMGAGKPQLYLPSRNSSHPRMTSKSMASQWVSNIELPKSTLISVRLYQTLTLAWIQLTIADANKVHAALTSNFFQTDGQGNYTIPCSTTTKLDVVLGGVEYSLNASSYIADITNVVNTFPNGTTTCLSSIQGVDGQDPVWTLGTSFLMNVHIPGWYWVRLILRCIRSLTLRRKRSHLLLRYSRLIAA
jgi:Eukaryotic aspartyl protease